MTNSLHSRLENIRLKIAGNDRLRAEPPLTEEELQAFERENGVTLPEDYRQFLKTVCNGVYEANDDDLIYGLYRLGELPRENWHTGNLGKPFPFTQKRDYEAEGYPKPEVRDGSTLDGRLYVCHAGCAQFWNLIVTGPERGNMWIYCEFGYYPSVPRVGFLDWCEQWAERGWNDGLEDLVLGGGQSPP